MEKDVTMKKQEAVLGSEGSKKKNSVRGGYRVGDVVVYPAHGVGSITDVEDAVFDGVSMQFYVIDFSCEHMTLRVPVKGAKTLGLRRLSSKDRIQKALYILRDPPQSKRAMWSRRAQEYESKIQSGDPMSIAEVLRDLSRRGEEGEPSYSEKQIYQTALNRLAREYAAVEKVGEDHAMQEVEKLIKAA